MLDYSFNEFVIINNLYFVFHYLFRGRFFFFDSQKKKRKVFFKGLSSSHSNLEIEYFQKKKKSKDRMEN